MSYIISTCTTADMTKEFMTDRDIKYIMFHYYVDEVEHLDDLGESMSMDDFFGAMAKGSMTRTSQPNAAEFIAVWEPYLQQGMDVVHLSLSSGISGVYNSAAIARDEMNDKYPDRKVYVVDSLCASGGLGLICDKAADLRDEGMPADELYAWLEEHKLELNHWFFTSDLTYLIRGGRVSKASGTIGMALSICPLLNVDFMGRLIARKKVRTKKKVIIETAETIKSLIQDRENYTGKIFINHAACYEDAKAVADLLEEALPKMNGKVLIGSIGTTIGSHTGPGTVACFFWGDKRVD